jgi:hypothetical protein
MAILARPREPGRAWDLAVAAALALAVGPGRLVDRAAHASLVVHMGVQHWLLAAAGALGARALAERLGGLGTARLLAWGGLGTFLVWHVPWLFGRAVEDPLLHGLMHLNYLGMGAGAAWGAPLLPPFERSLLGLGAAGLMGPLSLAMVAGFLRYPGYGSGEAQAAGVAMIVAMQLAWVALALGPLLRGAWRRSLALRAAVLGTLVAVVAAGFAT